MSNSKIKCPYCKITFPTYKHNVQQNVNKGTMNHYYFDINNCYSIPEYCDGNKYCIVIAQCPECKKDTIYLEEYNIEKNGDPQFYMVKPQTICENYPEYVPQSIRKDYQEACAIMYLSPKASATLARRCLQSMIRDFWKVDGKKSLNAEILAIESKVPATQWNAINAVRQLGNIGAHPERDSNLLVDIEDGEAEKMIKLIELLIDQWYINRYEQEQLYSDLVGINDEKQTERKKPR